MERSSPESLEEIREALRERGYLDSGLNRLLLEGAGSSAGWIRGALKASLLSGFFLGLCLLAALLLTNEPALTTPGDILVLSLYLLMLTFLGVGTFEFLVGVAARLLSYLLPGPRRDAERLAHWIGGSAALGSGLYLSLWWRGRGMTGWGIAAHLAIFAVILALSLGFGRITSLAALLSLIRPGRIPAPRGTRRAGALGLMLLLLLVGTVLAIPWERSRQDRSPAAPNHYEIHPRGGRVLWIGIDGLGTGRFRTLSEERRLPALTRLEKGSCRVEWSSPAAEPPAVWVTAATGFPATKHGVRAVQASTLTGLRTPLDDSTLLAPLVTAARWLEPRFRPVRQIPLSAGFRRNKTVWEILANQGVPSAVVNWWATWPADEGPGLRITERAFFKLESKEPFDREVYPPATFRSLREDLPEFLEGLRREGIDTNVPDDLPLILDAFHLARVRESWRLTPYPLAAVYLNGPDIIAGRARSSSAEADRARQNERLQAHLVSLDYEVGALATQVGPDDFLVIQGDPGREGERRKERGFLLLQGKGIRNGTRTQGDLLDVAPTLLLLLGFPRSTQMQGHPPLPCLIPFGDLARDVAYTVPSFGDRQGHGAEESDFDPEVLERLRSLGYVR